MILNETYDEILNKLDTYSLNEGFMDNLKAINRNWKIVQEFMKQVESELPGKIPDCKKVKISHNSSFKNVIDFEMFFNSKYERAELEKFLNKAVPIVNSMVTNILNKLLLKYFDTYDPSPNAAIYNPIVIEYWRVLFPRRYELTALIINS